MNHLFHPIRAFIRHYQEGKAMEKSRALNASNESVKQMIITPQKPRFVAERGWELGAKTPGFMPPALPLRSSNH